MLKNCEVCGKEFKTYPCHVKRGHGKVCSLKCKGRQERSTNSLGEIDGFNVYVDAQGYARIVFGRSDEKHLHVYVMEKHLGRKLEKGEHIHHLNQNKLDNRLENLRLVLGDKEHRKEHSEIRLIALGGTPGIHKYCPACKTMKTLEEFPRARAMYQGRHGFCKTCSSVKVRAYLEANRERVNKKRREKYST